MKLYFSPTSPYARKVLACAIARGIDHQVSLVTTDRDDPALLADNPLGKIPCLVTDDGVALFDSRVICEFLDSVGDVIPMFPSHGARFRALRLQAIADGMCDAALNMREDGTRPQESGRDTNMARQTAKIRRSLDVLEAEPPANHLDIGSVAVACALGYLDLRFANMAWRDGHPNLAAWLDTFGQQRCIADTNPL